MSTNKTRRRSAQVIIEWAWIAAGVILLPLYAGLSAAPVAAQEGTSSPAVAERTLDFDIPAQNLNAALLDFAERAGLQLIYDVSTVNDLRSAPLRGTFTPQEGLDRLLEGTGITHRFSGSTTVSLQKAKSSGVTVLNQITIQGEAGSGRIDGFRAERSSTALNIDAPLIETPATVNTITSDFLDTLQPRQFGELVDYVPGASISTKGIGGGFGNTDAFILRGFTISTEQSNGITIDRFVAPRQFYHFDRSLYQQVDILKGTASVQYGATSPGGIINYITKRPEFETAYSLEGTVGSDDHFRGSLDATGSLGNIDTLAYRLIVTAQDAEATFHGDDGVTFPDDKTIVNPQLTWRMPTEGALNLSYEYNDIESHSETGIWRLDNGEILYNRTFAGPESSATIEQHLARIEFTQPIFTDWEIVLGANYYESESTVVLDEAFGNFFSPTPLDGSPFIRFASIADSDDEESQFLAAVNGKFSTGEHVEHQVTVAFSHSDYERNVIRGFGFDLAANIDPFNPVVTGPSPAPAPTGPSIITEVTQDQFRLHDYVTIHEKLKIFGGLAILDYEAENFGSINEDDDVVDWNIGVVYNHSSLLNPFMSYGTSTEVQFGLLSGGGLVPAKESEQIEVGLKSEWFDERLLTTLSFFQIDQTNIAQPDPNDPTNTFSVLAGDIRTRGMELEATGRITDQVSLYGGYSYLDTEFVASVIGNEGNKQYGVPRHKFSLFGQYAFTGNLAGLTAGIGLIHVGERWASNANNYKVPAYERVDLTLGYKRGSFRVHGTLENLFDEDYIAASYNNDPSGWLIQGQKRFFTLTAGYDF